MIFGKNRFSKRSSINPKTNIQHKKYLELLNKHKVIIAILATLTIGSLSGLTYTYLQNNSEKNSHANKLAKIPFPTKNFHYGLLSNNQADEIATPSDINIFISLNDKPSKSAYVATKKYASNNNIKLNIHHLGQNPEWETSSRVFHTLSLLNPNIDLTPFFDFMITFNPKKNLLNEITPLLIEHGINTATFSNSYNSIDVFKKINQDINFSNSIKIEAIPSIIIHNKFIIYFGSFTSFEDSLRLYEALKNGEPSSTLPNKEVQSDIK
jgi:hypothetical protein